LVMIIYMKNNKYFNSGNKYLVDIWCGNNKFLKKNLKMY
jgi:hypothetical protein